VLDVCLYTRNSYQFDSLHLSLAAIYALITLKIEQQTVHSFKEIRFKHQLAFT